MALKRATKSIPLNGAPDSAIRNYLPAITTSYLLLITCSFGFEL